ncbi:MAG: hypothetical protein ACRC62_19985 [Microcoleus sp.]
MSKYVILYKWQKDNSGNWDCWEESIPYLDVPAWEHNGWTINRPSAPPIEPVDTPSVGRKKLSEVAA